MVRAGYPQAFAAGVICNAGTLGILIPPSIVMVVYGAATETSVGKLFMAGVIPGHRARPDADGRDLRARARASTCRASRARRCAEVLASGRDSLWGLLLLVIILGGIYGGIFTPTEAAAVVRRLRVLRRGVRLPRHRHDATCRGCWSTPRRVTVMLMFIIANALLFAHVLTTERIPQVIAEHDRRLGHGRPGSS